MAEDEKEVLDKAFEDDDLHEPVGDVTDDPVEEDSPVPDEETPPPTPPPGVRDIAGEFGIDLSGYEDDGAAIRHLAEQAKAAREKSELAAYGQEFVKHAADGSWQQYQSWKEEQARQQPAETKLWDPPEWNPNWATQLKQDESGNIVPDYTKGGTPETVAKFQRYLAFRQEQQDRFWSDPFKYIEPYVSRAAEERAKSLIEERLQQFGSELDARHFVLANDWLWEDKANKVLSEEGKFFAQKFNEIDKDEDLKGISQRGKEKLALQALDGYRAQKTAAAQPTPEDKKIATLKKAAGYSASAGGSETKKTPDGSPAAQNDNDTFVEMLRAEFAAAGVEPHQQLVEV